MRAPTSYLLALLLSVASCSKSSAPQEMNISQGPGGGGAGDEKPMALAEEDFERSAGNAAPATPTATVPMDPPKAAEPLPTPDPAAAFLPPQPMPSNGPQPVVDGAAMDKSSTFDYRADPNKMPPEVIAGIRGEPLGAAGTSGTTEPPPPPDAKPTDSLEKALEGGWRGGQPERPELRAGRFGDSAEVPETEEGELGFDGDDDDDLAIKAKPDKLELAARVKGEEKKEERERNIRSEIVADEQGRDDDGKNWNRGTHTLRATGEDPAVFVPPPTTLPRMFYFENTYLGGSAAYAERLRRLDQALQNETRPYEVVQAEVQPFDAPRTEGLGVTASIDATHFEKARRVFLQVGLRGSSRYGWRRPPLDIVLVVDQPAFARGAGFVTRFVVDLLRQLGPADRLGIVLAGQSTPTFLDLARLNSAQQHLANRIDELAAPAIGGPVDLASAMRRAGVMLDEASDDEATVPGTKTLMVLSGEHDHARIDAAAKAAHELTVLGCVTSVFALDAERSEWWQVANAGFGNLHRIDDEAFGSAIDEEMQSLARVVARLVRVNVRLGKDAKAIRVLGTRVLEQREVDEVKARELATDINLSKSLGITSDRGEDDDGIQTVIPYFYGDDSHVLLIELWLEGAGTIADVTVRYKDMVNLDNATARTSVRIGARPQAPTREQILIARNVRGFELAENLQKASDAVLRNDFGTAVKNLGAARGMAAETNMQDVQAIDDLKAMVERGDWQNDAGRRATVQETLLFSGQRRVGDTNKLKR